MFTRRGYRPDPDSYWIQERRRGDDPDDLPVRRISREELAVICGEYGYWPE
jgi:hypothetical protein